MAILRPTGIVDGDFIPDTPTKLLERGEYNHVDVIIGVTKDEGLLQMVNFVLDPSLYLSAFVSFHFKAIILKNNEGVSLQNKKVE